jgi:hypothetical protein
MLPTPLVSETLVQRVRAEFEEMPGLKLTIPQAQRLLGLDRPTCEAVCAELTRSQFLDHTRDGCVMLRGPT